MPYERMQARSLVTPRLLLWGCVLTAIVWQISPQEILAAHIYEEGRVVYFKYAFIDKNGKQVFEAPAQYECGDFSDGLLKIEEDKSSVNADSSYLNEAGKVVAKGFKRALPFSEGLARVGEVNKTGFIDHGGNLVIKPKFNDAERFQEGLAPVMVNRRFGFADKTGAMVIDPFYEDVSGFSEGLAAVQSQGKIGFIDRKGSWRIKPQFHYVDGFSDGLALVRTNQAEFFMDATGRAAITLTEEQRKRRFVPWGISGSGLSSQYGFFRGFNSRTYGNNCTFREGLAPMVRNGKYGYIDKSGSFAIEPRFDVAYPFVEGLAIVILDKKCGFMDKTGKLVVEPKFARAEDFSEGVAAVAVGHNKWGYINQRGNFVVQPTYIHVGPFRNGRACVQLTGCYNDGIE